MTTRDVISYSKGSKWLHWIVAGLVVVMLSGGFFLEDLPDAMVGTAFLMHKSIGLTILSLMLMRLFWIAHTGKPPYPPTVRVWERWLSWGVQTALYVFLIAMPMSGWIMSVAKGKTPTFFGLFEVPLYGIPLDKAFGTQFQHVHTYIAWILIVLIALHIAGALKHYFIDRDEVLNRML